MAQVLKFPVKKEIPKELEERLQKVVVMYVGEIANIMDEICEGIDDPEEFSEMTDLMLGVMVESVLGIIEKEES